MIERSTVTCPKCGHQAIERMPTNACQFFYDCKGCGGGLKPLPGIGECFVCMGQYRASQDTGISTPGALQVIMGESQPPSCPTLLLCRSSPGPPLRATAP